MGQLKIQHTELKRPGNFPAFFMIAMN